MKIPYMRKYHRETEKLLPSWFIGRAGKFPTILPSVLKLSNRLLYQEKCFIFSCQLIYLFSSWWLWIWKALWWNRVCEPCWKGFIRFSWWNRVGPALLSVFHGYLDCHLSLGGFYWPLHPYLWTWTPKFFPLCKAPWASVWASGYSKSLEGHAV